ncbi:MAG: hypothetical protein WCL43_09380 [Chlorobium sp.]|jgi:hypothetical protein
MKVALWPLMGGYAFIQCYYLHYTLPVIIAVRGRVNRKLGFGGAYVSYEPVA